MYSSTPEILVSSFSLPFILSFPFNQSSNPKNSKTKHLCCGLFKFFSYLLKNPCNVGILTPLVKLKLKGIKLPIQDHTFNRSQTWDASQIPSDSKAEMLYHIAFPLLFQTNDHYVFVPKMLLL